MGPYIFFHVNFWTTRLCRRDAMFASVTFNDNSTVDIVYVNTWGTGENIFRCTSEWANPSNVFFFFLADLQDFTVLPLGDISQSELQQAILSAQVELFRSREKLSISSPSTPHCSHFDWHECLVGFRMAPSETGRIIAGIALVHK